MALKTITVLGNDLVIRKEAIATEAITPGHQIEIIAGGAALIADVSDGLVHQAAFAVENEVVGKDITEAYAIDDTLLYGIFPAGSEVYALVDAAVTIYGLLEATVTGALSPISTGVAVAIALETTGGSGRCLVEIL